MSSTNKYPSGLNNWLDTDRPERLDFVTDNEVIDQNALWKDDYDANGVVAQSGGIDAFALAKDTYDPTGTVAAAGGISSAIQSAVSVNEGYSTYTHSKTGTVHSLTNATGGSIIRFVATADFVSGDTFTVNGVSYTAITTDGQNLAGGCFIQNTVVTCYKNGTVLNFKTGGAGLNFSFGVAASSSALPTAAAKNRIIGISSTPLPTGDKKFVIGSGTPTVSAWPVGSLWLKTGTVNTYSFNGLKSQDMIYIFPDSLYQQRGGSWVNIDGYIDRTTAWQKFSSAQFVIFDGSVNNTVNGVGTMSNRFQTGDSAGGALNISSGRILQSSQQKSGSAGGSRGDYGSTVIDLTNFSKLTIVVSAVAGVPYRNRVGFLNSTSYAVDTNNRQQFTSWAAYNEYTSAGTKTVNLAGISGVRYLGIETETNSTTVTSHSITKLILE